jgi:hypothetical protein
MSTASPFPRVSVYQLTSGKPKASYAGWALIASLGWAVQEGVMRYAGENVYFYPRLIFTYIFLFFIPAALVYLSRKFYESAKAIHPYLDVATDCESFATQQTRAIFSQDAVLVKTISIVIAALATIAVYATIGIPFRSILANAVIMPLGFIGALIGGHAGYQGLAAIWFITRYSKHPLRDVFFYNSSDAIAEITSNYSAYAALNVFGFIVYVLGIWASGHIAAPAMVTLIGLTSFWPLAALVWTLYSIHVFMTRIKKQNLHFIKERVGHFGISRVDIKTLEDLDRVSSIMVLQDHVDRMREWPLYVSTLATLGAAIAAPLAQVAIRAALP